MKTSLEETIEPRIGAKFLERIVAILPIHLPQMKNAEVVDILEIMVKHNLGSERLWEQYLLLSIEKNVLHYSPQ